MGGGKVYQADPRVGAFLPLGYWDPTGFATEVTEGQLAYIREAELKHGRICMLASLGIFVAEKWHPLFGGAIDGTALQAIGRAELNQFWPAVLLATGGSSSSLRSEGPTQLTIQETGVTSQETPQ